MRLLVAEGRCCNTESLVGTLGKRLGWDVIQAEDGNARGRPFEDTQGKGTRPRAWPVGSTG